MKTEYEKACAELNFQPLTQDDFLKFPEEDRISMFAYHKLTMCIRAENLDKATGKKYIPDWLNRDEWKWWNWFIAQKDNSKPSGVGFSFNDSVDVIASATVGSRLVSKNRDIAQKIGNNPEMIEYYNEFIILQ